VTDQWFSPCTSVSSTNKIDRHDTTENYLNHHKPKPQTCTPKNVLLGQWLNNTEIYLTLLLVLKIT
jgi:hypothetical protein